jgi:N-acetylglucosaminyl-diphospho-decaprenol L-rhamnosyltransferase
MPAAAHQANSAIDAPWVRVIIVNYNGGPLIQRCVNALATQTMGAFEAFIVDNASTDGSAVKLRLPDPRFTLIKHRSNIGFAAANNLGAQGCRAPWVATLNPDTEAKPNWLEEMRRGAERYPTVRMFGATLISAADPKVADGFGDVLSIAGIPWRGGNGHLVSDLPMTDLEVFGPCAAAALYDRKVFEEVEGFDESFFCYIEDVDLAFRLRLRGERCMQLRNAIVLHYGSAITGPLSEFTILHSFRNRLWMILKNMPLLLMFVALPANLFCSIFIILLSYRQIPVRAAVKGLGLGLVNSSGLFKKRRRIQSTRCISVASLAKNLVWDLRQLHYRPIKAVIARGPP